MDGRRIRVEIIRFSLLITVTIALVSVATRHGDHRAGRETGARKPASIGVTTSPTAVPTAAAGGTSGTGTSGGSGAAGSRSSRPSTGAPGAGQGGGSEQVAELPRTGAAQAADLGALAVLFIAAGSFSVAISRRGAGPTVR